MLGRAVAVLGVAAVLVGCGGAEPAPAVPAAPAPAPAGPPGQASEAACNELFLGLSSLATASGGSRQPAVSEITLASANGPAASGKGDGKASPATILGRTPTAASLLRLSSHVTVTLAGFRAQLKRAVELDRSVAGDVEEVDRIIASSAALLEAVTKAQEAHAKQMRDISGEIDRLRGWFTASCKAKDADCTAKTSIAVSMLLTELSAAALPRARGEIQKVELKTPEALAKRAELVQKMDEAERLLLDQQKQSDALTKESSGEERVETLGKALEKLYTRCGLEKDHEKAAMAVRRPQWVTTKEPDLRKMVVVVRVLPEGRIRARLDEWAQASQSSARREAFEGATHGGFGSGFFVMPRAGEAFIVTNRHVVDYGDHASLLMPDGTTMAADIVYTDPNADLAVLKPAKVTVTYGLGLDPDGAKDRQPVIATGYPGLDARPSYQTTRGYVSNMRFLDPRDNSPYIQHTAPIDKGASGGPLTSEHLGVMGVNTLKIHERENVAMAVPATLVADAVAHADTKTDASALQRDARATCLEIVAELGAPKPDVMVLYRRISLAMVGESGSASFNAMATRDRELGEMLLDSPIDALRAAVVDRIVAEGRVARINPFETCANPHPDDWQHIETMDRVRFQLRVGADMKDLVLRREHGRFQLLRLDLIPSIPDPPAGAVKKPAGKKPAGKKPAQTPQK